MSFLSKHCVPCEGGVAKMTREEAEAALKHVPGWELLHEDVLKIEKSWKCMNFVEAMRFVNKVADLAEQENHHPNISISYSRVTLTLWTHAIGGLSENDFIVAATVDAIGSPVN